MQDRIRVTNLVCDTVIGVYDWERRVRQRVSVDLELACDLSAAAASDRVEDTVDYKQLSQRVQARVASSRYRLVETLAHDVVELCLAYPRVASARVTLHKPGALRHADDVAVEVERSRDDPPARPPHRALVGVGSNVEPVRHVRYALARLHERFGAVRVSPAYRTKPVATTHGAPGGPDFLNLAVELRTDLPPSELVDWLHALEEEAGRMRGELPDAPRELDLDLLLYDEVVDPDGPPVLPHRLLAREAFALVPAADLLPEARHPTEGVPLGELRARLPERPPGVVLFEEEVLF